MTSQRRQHNYGVKLRKRPSGWYAWTIFYPLSTEPVPGCYGQARTKTAAHRAATAAAAELPRGAGVSLLARVRAADKAMTQRLEGCQSREKRDKTFLRPAGRLN